MTNSRSLLSKIIFSYSDDRNDRVMSNSRNKYGCKNVPYENYLSYSSATATNIQSDQFKYLSSIFDRFQSEDLSYASWQSLRDRIRSIFDLQDDIDIIFGSSGTDIEIIATLYGIAANKQVCSNIISLPEEIGSGSIKASKCCHFGNTNNHHQTIFNGSQITGFSDFEIISHQSGNCIDSSTHRIHCENELLNLVADLVARKHHVQLHLVYGSKLGRVYPSLQIIDILEKRYPNNLDIIVDACQFRVSHTEINKWLEKGRIVLLSGSKFYEGVTFSGLMLLPSNIRDRINNLSKKLPIGLSDYFSRDLFPKRLEVFDLVTTTGDLKSLYLRIESFMYNAERFAQVKEHRIHEVIKYFCERCAKLFLDSDLINSSQVNLYMDETTGLDPLLRTIYPFSLTYKGKPLELTECKKLYDRLMCTTQDLNHKDDILSKTNERGFLKYVVHLPQPVLIKHGTGQFAALRIALGSKYITELAGLVSTLIEKKLDNDFCIIEKKIEYLLNSDFK